MLFYLTVSIKSTLFYFDVLQVLLHFLSKVAAAEIVNKMNLNNVAMIMAPNLFLRASSQANLNEVNKAASTTDIMRMLIKYQSIIWTVSSCLFALCLLLLT